MLRIRISHFLVLLVIYSSLGVPTRDDDDEYEDDIEFPVRQADLLVMAKLKEKLQLEQHIGPTTTSRPNKPLLISSSPNLFSQSSSKWVHANQVKGYQILSDGPKIVTQLIKTRPMFRIRIDAPGTVRHVEQSVNKKNLELKIRHWDAVHKVQIQVPFGYEPEDLYVAELKDHIDIVAPLYSDIDENESALSLANLNFDY